MRRVWSSAITLGAVAAVSGSACRRTVDAQRGDVQTFAVSDLAYSIERHRGQTVRICGALGPSEDAGIWRLEDLRATEASQIHGRPAVLIAACGGNRPPLDRRSCLTGRIARRDGSLTYPPGAPVAVDDVRTNYEWFLHPQCPSR